MVGIAPLRPDLTELDCRVAWVWSVGVVGGCFRNAPSRALGVECGADSEAHGGKAHYVLNSCVLPFPGP